MFSLLLCVLLFEQNQGCAITFLGVVFDEMLSSNFGDLRRIFEVTFDELDTNFLPIDLKTESWFRGVDFVFSL